MIESKKRSKGNNFKILLLMSLIASSLTLITSNQSRAAECKPVKPRGQSVGSIKYGSRSMPIIPFTYPAGGVMEPQKTTKAAASINKQAEVFIKARILLLWWCQPIVATQLRVNRHAHKKLAHSGRAR